MQSKALYLLLILSFTSYSQPSAEQQLSRMINSAECLGYMTLFNNDEQSASVQQVRQLVSIFKESSKIVLQSPKMREVLSKGIFAKSGVKFSDEFYSGSILTASREEVTSAIKDKFGGREIKDNADLNTLWGYEAKRRFDSSSCNLIK